MFSKIIVQVRNLNDKCFGVSQEMADATTDASCKEDAATTKSNLKNNKEEKQASSKGKKMAKHNDELNGGNHNNNKAMKKGNHVEGGEDDASSSLESKNLGLELKLNSIGRGCPPEVYVWPLSVMVLSNIYFFEFSRIFKHCVSNSGEWV